MDVEYWNLNFHLVLIHLKTITFEKEGATCWKACRFFFLLLWKMWITLWITFQNKTFVCIHMYIYTYIYTYTHIYMYTCMKFYCTRSNFGAKFFDQKSYYKNITEKNYKNIATILQKCYLLESILTTSNFKGIKLHCEI